MMFIRFVNLLVFLKSLAGSSRRSCQNLSKAGADRRWANWVSGGAPKRVLTGLSSIACLMPTMAWAELSFAEVSAEWGLDFRHRHGGSGQRYMTETMVGGVVLFDFDGDGDQDVFFVDGGPTPGYQGVAPSSRLFRNDNGSFADVTEDSGIVVRGYGAGGAAADFDGDGDTDLYVTAFGANQLFVNQGDGTFVDGTETAGVGEPRWSAAAAFADIDGDRDLDLFVSNYVDFDYDNHRFCGDEESNTRAYCHPGVYDGLGDRLFRNRGDGTFEDWTTGSGVGEARSPGLGVVFGDLDDDGDADLYVANDTDPNLLYLNRGDGTFEDMSLLSGTSHSDRGRPEAGMRVALGELDGDGRPDLVVTNFELETNGVYKNNGGGLFSDVRFISRVAEPTLLKLAFGTCSTDLDGDGDLDLVFANGHILDNAEALDPKSHYRQPNQIFENVGGRFAEAQNIGLSEVRASRGSACGDLDGDGDPDLVFVNSNDRAEVYENRSKQGRIVTVEVLDEAGTSFPGAAVRLEDAAGKKLWRESYAGSSYLSQHPLTLHFGLGAQSGFFDIEVRPGPGRVRLRWQGLREVGSYRVIPSENAGAAQPAEKTAEGQDTPSSQVSPEP